MHNSSNSNSCRRIRFRLRSKFNISSSNRSMVPKRKRIFNKRKRISCHLLRFKTTFTTPQRIKNKNLHRQYHNPKVQFKIRGNSLNHITKLSSENPKYLQRLRFRHRVRTYSRREQHPGRLVKPTNTPDTTGDLRSNTS